MRRPQIFTMIAVLASASIAPIARSQSLAYSISGEHRTANFGISIDAVPDFDGDGADEILVGAPGSLGRFGLSGPVQVLSGRTGQLLQSIGGIDRHSPSTPALPLRERRGEHGRLVRCVGDVNGDGRADYAISSMFETVTLAHYKAGRVHVHSGTTGLRLFSANGRSSFAEFGSKLDELGDVNGDGHGDLIVGAPRHTASTANGDLYSAGAAYVLSGIDGSMLFEYEGDHAYSRVGRQVSGLGDIDLDGVRDFAVLTQSPGGATSSAPSVVRIHSGATGQALYELTAAASSATAPYAASYGETIARTDDLDGDGTEDFVIGAPRSGSGAVLVYSGRTGQWLRTHTGANSLSRFGSVVRANHDLDGDGVKDLVVAEPGFRVGQHSQGRASAFSGANGSTLFEIVGLPGTGFFSQGLAVGDFSGDGVVDVAGGAPVVNAPLLQSGRLDVYWR